MTTINEDLSNVNPLDDIESQSHEDILNNIPENNENRASQLRQARAYVNATTKHQAKKKGKKQHSGDFPPESLYAQTIADDENYAVAERDENVTLYKWQGNFWKKLSRHEGVKAAYNWLKVYAADSAGAKLAAEAFRTALLDAKPLPLLTQRPLSP